MPESRHNFAIALVSGLPAIAGTFVGMRMYARYRQRIKFGWDDWLLVLATLLSLGLIAPSIMYLKMRYSGYHIWEIGLSTQEMDPDFEDYTHVQLAINLLNTPILPLAKASIILILLRVGKIILPVRRCLYVVFAFNLLACVVPWVMTIFMCPARTGNTWAPTTFGNLRCFGRDSFGKILLFINCANLLTDVLIFPIPFFIMRELMNTGLRARVTVILTFASSLCVTALSAVKVYVTYRDRILLVAQPDWTYSIEFCISHGESNVGIMVACIPTLRGMITRGLKRARTSDPEQTGSFPGFNMSSNFSTRGSVTSPQRHNSLMFHDDYLLKSPDPFVSPIPEVHTTLSIGSDKPRKYHATSNFIGTIPPRPVYNDDPAPDGKDSLPGAHGRPDD
ncbi:hypothetical protein AJ79_10173 [Helicocarpus griseus UAMH5409]|uniref:Rhodopsin domain-containing protein n=1 Tax=Helicocarpus griseus UAMH5409 TaxID=1447875 RepID=A0A2B7WF58_9EURO|nr:hypothetical protein AJ79_10173 [Helicocarpus griseus UAMH5409]